MPCCRRAGQCAVATACRNKAVMQRTKQSVSCVCACMHGALLEMRARVGGCVSSVLREWLARVDRDVGVSNEADSSKSIIPSTRDIYLLLPLLIAISSLHRK